MAAGDHIIRLLVRQARVQLAYCVRSMPKGQEISEEFVLVFNSSKKKSTKFFPFYSLKVSWFRNVFLVSWILPNNEWKQFDLRYHSSKVEFFVRFLAEWKISKRHFEINWPLAYEEWLNQKSESTLLLKSIGFETVFARSSVDSIWWQFHQTFQANLSFVKGQLIL